MKVSKEEIINFTTLCTKFQSIIIISSDQHFYEQLLTNIHNNIEKNIQQITNIFIINTSETKNNPSFYDKFTLTHGSVLSAKEIHDAFCAFENKWHDTSCSICKNLVNIKNELPKFVDVLIVDTNDFISYFEYKKILDTCNCKEQYLVESKNPSSLFNLQ